MSCVGEGKEGDLKHRLWKEEKPMEDRYSDVLETLSPRMSEKGGCLSGCNGEVGMNGQYIGEFSVMVNLEPNSQNVIYRKPLRPSGGGTSLSCQPAGSRGQSIRSSKPA